jgi:hypothetical protein
MTQLDQLISAHPQAAIQSRPESRQGLQIRRPADVLLRVIAVPWQAVSHGHRLARPVLRKPDHETVAISHHADTPYLTGNNPLPDLLVTSLPFVVKAQVRG